MKIAFLHDWEPPYEYELVWLDGLAAALAELRNRGHEVKLWTVGNDTVIKNQLNEITMTPDPVKAIARWEPEVILHWADMTRPHARPLQILGIPMAICFAGGDPLGENMPFFDHVFVESSIYAKQLEGTDIPVSIAFGTNTTLFTPFDPPLEKMWDTIFPATFAAWKRHYLYAQAVEGRFEALAVGHQYDDHEQDCWQECLNRGLTVMPYVDAITLRQHYGRSRVCVITSSSAGGSQRTILEAMSMNMPVVITDSDKFTDYVSGQASVIQAEPNPESIREAIHRAMQTDEINSRDYILAGWSEFTYADALEKGLQGIL